MSHSSSHSIKRNRWVGNLCLFGLKSYCNSGQSTPREEDFAMLLFLKGQLTWGSAGMPQSLSCSHCLKGLASVSWAGDKADSHPPPTKTPLPPLPSLAVCLRRDHPSFLLSGEDHPSSALDLVDSCLIQLPLLSQQCLRGTQVMLWLNIRDLETY